jgi:hypothetical protein
MPQPERRDADFGRGVSPGVVKVALISGTIAGVLLVGCGGGDDVPEDERERQVTGIAELATAAYAAAGAEGLYDYLAEDVTATCSKESLVKALEGEPVPDGFKAVDSVEFDGDEARAKVVQLFGEEEREVEWTFAREGDDSWRLTKVPGLEACES